MNKKRYISNFALLIIAMIWGTAFVAQAVGMEHVGSFTFNATRGYIAGFALIPVIFLMRKHREKSGVVQEPLDKKVLIQGGVCCGIALFLGSATQQFGIALGTETGKAGFITAMYILAVPIIGLFLKKPVRPIIWACIAAAVVGLFLLCVSDGIGSITLGEVIILISTVGFAIHILVIDHFSPKTDGVIMSCIQFFVCSIISTIMMFIFETPTWENIWAARVAIFYTGAISSCVGYTGQILAQKHTSPTVASLIMSLESVFAVLAGAVLLGQMPSSRELLGCTIMFIAIIVAQLPEKEKTVKI